MPLRLLKPAATGTAVLAALLVTLAILMPAEHGADAAASDVRITALSCDSNPEYVRIKNFGNASQSLSGFMLESDPNQSYTLTDFVAGIGAGQAIEFQAGSSAAANNVGSRIAQQHAPADRGGKTANQMARQVRES